MNNTREREAREFSELMSQCNLKELLHLARMKRLTKGRELFFQLVNDAVSKSKRTLQEVQEVQEVKIRLTNEHLATFKSIATGMYFKLCNRGGKSARVTLARENEKPSIRKYIEAQREETFTNKRGYTLANALTLDDFVSEVYLALCEGITKRENDSLSYQVVRGCYKVYREALSKAIAHSIEMTEIDDINASLEAFKLIEKAKD
jgi:hypothetical protein